MNRSITNVLFGAFGSVSNGNSQAAGGEMREVNLEDTATQTSPMHAGRVVPGYGMATAVAEQSCASWRSRWRTARSPWSSRSIRWWAAMQGHMNVLLAEANAPGP